MSPVSLKRAGANAGVWLALGAGVLGAAAFASLVALPAATAFAGDATAAVENARKKVRVHDVKGALLALEQALAQDPANADANILYQDLTREVAGTAALLTKYKDLAAKAPQDAFLAFLVARLGSPDAVAKDCDVLKRTFPDSPWPHAGRARALADEGKWEEAVTEFDVAIQRAGSDVGRFLAYRASALEQGGKWSQAADAWKLAADKLPGDVSARMGLGEALRKIGAADDAIKVFEDVRKLAPMDAEAAWRIGLCHSDAHRYADALKAFETALAIDRTMVEASCSASEALVRKARATADAENRDITEEDLAPAITAADRAVIMAPDSAYAQFTLGAAHEAAGEVNAEHLEPALKAYDAAIERMPIPGPEKVRAFCAKSYVLLRLARWTEAQDAADRALGIDPKNAIAFGHAAHALASQGKQKDAIDKYYKPGIKAAPEDARLQHDMGVALWEMKKVNDAKKPLEEAAKLDPKNPTYLHSLGEWYYEVKRYKEGSAILAEATELAPRNAEIWGSYAKVTYSAKQWEECARAFEKVIELVPDAVDEHLFVAVVYADQLKDKAKAKPHVLKFQELGGSDPNLDSWMTNILEDTK